MIDTYNLLLSLQMSPTYCARQDGWIPNPNSYIQREEGNGMIRDDFHAVQVMLLS